LQLSLCGQTPEVALQSAAEAVKFYMQQQRLQHDLKEGHLQRKIGKVQEACKKKLEEVHHGYQVVSAYSCPRQLGSPCGVNESLSTRLVAGQTQVPGDSAPEERLGAGQPGAAAEVLPEGSVSVVRTMPCSAESSLTT
jgi:hypothetical protein